MRHATFLGMLLLFHPSGLAQQNAREQKVRADKAKVEAADSWIYNDMGRGFAEARRTGKPIVVVLRCIPCEECVKLDDDLVEGDPVLRPLLDQFVRVRIVGTNGLDLSLFQYDTDQSFAVFLLNADGTIYGRFGTRSHRTEWLGDVSLKGMARALQGALDLHANYPQNAKNLAGKRGGPPEVASPELFPSLRDKYGAKLDYDGNVVKSCIHCHQIGDAQRELYRGRGEAIPERVLFPYPHPKSIGLKLDPSEKARIKEVEPDSWAAKAGFRDGDDIESMNGQPLLSMADVQWVLHQTPAGGGDILAEVRRGGSEQTLTLRLPGGWRRQGDLSWRVSSWGLRRMVLGGMVLEKLPDGERPAVKVEGTPLRVKSVGKFGAHAAAHNAGIQPGDILVSYDGKDSFPNEGNLLAYAVNAYKPGDRVTIRVLREEKALEFTLPIQE
ncbi:MAG: Trx7/PDZ domain-containing (seleno)protein [Isosphaeraceae bacterium]